MRINESNMTLESSGFQKTTKVQVASLEVWGNPDSEQGTVQEADALSISEAGANQSFAGYHFLSMEEIKEVEELEALDEDFVSEEDKLKIQLLEAFMSFWMKRDFKISNMTLHTARGDDQKEKVVEEKLRRLDHYNTKKEALLEKRLRKEDGVSGKRSPMGSQEGWGIRYSRYEEETKSQRLDFNAKGKVVLGDGREIQVDYHLHMSEHSYKQSLSTFKAGDALIDPIVINYAGPTAKLTQEKYAFDIDMDGAEDQISFATNGSGFLALDRNENGWIDENDPIFHQLRIWERTSDGGSKLLSLGEVGIGAIYLKDITTLFDISDEQLNMQAKMRTSSIFLKEDGTAGSVHEIDLVI